MSKNTEDKNAEVGFAAILFGVIVLILVMTSGEGTPGSFSVQEGIVTAILAALYFVPIIVAYNRNAVHFQAIGVLNLLAGWTFIGWIVALIWAMVDEPEKQEVDQL